MTPKAQAAYQEALMEIEKCRKEKRTVLGLSDLGLTALPPEISQLTALTGLFLHNNQLTALPPEIGQLTALTELILTNNRLTALPPEIGQLRALRRLLLFRNKLTALRPEIGQLTALTTLYLENNQLTILPPEIGQLTAITELFLSNNQLTALPPEIGQLMALTGLDISYNQLTALPPEIGQLMALVTLALRSNRLTSIPSAIGRLQKLQFLDLQHNSLGSLPESIVRLVSLRWLYLHGNQPLGLLQDALGPRWSDIEWTTPPKVRPVPKPPHEILDYYFQIQQGCGEALRELRVIVVGNAKAGKTTLIKRLDGKAMNPSEPETHGINISAMEFQCMDGPLQARVWDFGGQHVLHAMHEFFLTRRCLYLLVLEQRTDRMDKDAKYWLQVIRSYAPDAPVVIALNQSGGVERPWSRAALERDYGPIAGVVATECLPEEKWPGAQATIEALCMTLARAMDGMTEPRQLFPKKWSGIKRWLEEMKEPFLDFAAFAARCVKDEPDRAKQAELAALMNDLGIAMNYARDERLRDTTVLRPDWLANGIYAILRANMLNREPLAPGGVITENHLGAIYPAAERAGMLLAAEYPKDKFPFLLRLMGLFRLSFPLDERDERHLVPALLLPDEPADCVEPADADRVRLRCDFDVVPAPFMGRLIVSLFPLVEPGRAWQRGACLRYGEARARVWMDVNEDKVSVTVGGPAEQREELLGMIRATLRRMRAEYRGLRMTEHRETGGFWLPHDYLVERGDLPPDPGATPAVGLDVPSTGREDEPV